MQCQNLISSRGALFARVNFSQGLKGKAQNDAVLGLHDVMRITRTSI
jgi:hypothetical protein